MNRTYLTRTSGVAALALSMSLGLAACSSEDDSGEPAAEETSSAPAESESPIEAESDAMAADAVFGPGCDAVPTDGPGSVDGMATDPVATAAGNNPLLGTLVDAVGQADLADTLNSAEDITVFAPTDDAFGQVPQADLTALLGDPQQLSGVLTHHVVPERLAPEDLAGEHETLNGDMVTVEGSGEELTVGDEDAAVLCGNIQTANATVYVIDTVLMP
jgi:uncharacterized surface protein with fasciclin (FAS1) repeats